MATTHSTIRQWIDKRPEGCTHMIVVCDTFDWDDYPVYCPSASTWAAKDVGEVVKSYDGPNMQKVMEVYSFTGKHSIDDQLAEHRARYLD